MAMTLSAPQTPRWVDTHVHVFDQHAPLAAERRYAPDYAALPSALLENMRAEGVAQALLVQPSFFGTDNRFLLEAIAAQSAHFAGIAVVDPATDLKTLASLKEAGIVGLRLNCIGKSAPDFSSVHGKLAQALAALDMVLQIQAEGAQWQAMEPFLADSPVRVVIDHFGRTALDQSDGGFASLLRAARSNDSLWFKFSAPYRMAEGQAAECAAALLEAVGPERIVWGSDWPATQFEGRHRYSDTLAWLSEWVPDPDQREAILSKNPKHLYQLPWD